MKQSTSSHLNCFRSASVSSYLYAAVVALLLATILNSFLFGTTTTGITGAEATKLKLIDCPPLKSLIANRFSRSSIKNLRMLRDDRTLGDMEHLIRTHYNCLLQSDRIRFKKSGPLPIITDDQWSPSDEMPTGSDPYSPRVTNDNREQIVNRIPVDDLIYRMFKSRPNEDDAASES